MNVLGPEIVIIGGGVTEALGEPYLEHVRTAARGQTLADPEAKIRIERAALGDDAGILGAAARPREVPDELSSTDAVFRGRYSTMAQDGFRGGGQAVLP